MSTALLIIDYINEIVDTKGKLAAKGYAKFIEENNTFEKLNSEIDASTTRGEPIIFVGLGFAENWADQPKNSPVFGKAHEFGILQRGTWSTAVHDSVHLPAGTIVLSKQRVSAFYGTGLESLLRNLGISTVRIAGVATDLAVEAAARDAHDRDFKVEVVAAASAAASDEDQERALATIAKFATVVG